MSNPTHLRRAATRAASAIAFAAIVMPTAAHAATPVNLATANAFVVLGGSTVTNTGPSVLNGDLGVSPGTALPGFGPATINGATHANDAVAAQAQLDLTTAYNVAAGQTPATDKSGQDLGGQHLAAGAYAYSSDAQLTGTLTLDAGGDPNAQFVIMIASRADHRVRQLGRAGQAALHRATCTGRSAAPRRWAPRRRSRAT